MSTTTTGLGVLSQPPLLQWDDRGQRWLLWLSYNKQRTAGTYLVLAHDGSIQRQTMQPTGEVTETTPIKPPGV